MIYFSYSSLNGTKNTFTNKKTKISEPNLKKRAMFSAAKATAKLFMKRPESISLIIAGVGTTCYIKKQNTEIVLAHKKLITKVIEQGGDKLTNEELMSLINASDNGTIDKMFDLLSGPTTKVANAVADKAVNSIIKPEEPGDFIPSPQEADVFSLFNFAQFFIIVEGVILLLLSFYFYKKFIIPFKREWQQKELSLAFITKLIRFSLVLNVISLWGLFWVTVVVFGLQDLVVAISELQDRVILLFLDKT